MDRKIIFVSGIHGVGKTTFSKELASIMKINHYSSSELIKKYNSQLEFVNKKIRDVHKNQNALIDSIEKNVKDFNFILDGHFTLLSKSNNIVDIPLDTFKKLNPYRIYLLVLEPELIATRLSTRSNNEFSTKTIEPLQEREIEQAESVSKILNIELIKLTGVESINEYLTKFERE